MWVRSPRQFRDAVFHVWHWDGTVLDSDLGHWMGLDADDCQGFVVASLSQAEALGGTYTLLAVLSLSSLCVLSLSLVWYHHCAYCSHPPRCAISLLTMPLTVLSEAVLSLCHPPHHHSLRFQGLCHTVVSILLTLQPPCLLTVACAFRGKCADRRGALGGSGQRIAFVAGVSTR